MDWNAPRQCHVQRESINEVFRGKERLIMMVNGAGFMNKDDGVTLLTFTDKHLKKARLEEDKRH